MRIALVAPVEEPVPPPRYGGIEGVVAELAVGLAARGHAVTLLASGDSRCAAGELLPVCPTALRRTEACPTGDGARLEQLKVEAAERAAGALARLRPDVVHNHMWRLLDLRHRVDRPMLTTVHYPLDRGHRRSAFLRATDAAFVSISYSQQRSAGGLRFVANVYNGIDVSSFEPALEGGDGLLFLGRLTPDKGADIAIRVAQSLGVPLTIAAKVAHDAQDYYQQRILPYLDGRAVRYVGEVDQLTKRALLARAAALLYPVRWSEPFGLAMVEAMASGTPVVAFDRGGVGEVVVSGQTGFVVDNARQMAARVRGIGQVSRRACREHVLARFTSARMVDEYERVYRRLALAA
jgi:glycosyltransferase involved in cell wall biosynthesis